MQTEKPFKVIAVVQFNKDEAIVLDRPIKLSWEPDGKSFIGYDGPFRDYLAYEYSSGNMKAFGGAELTLNMYDGSVKKIKDHWWHTSLEGTRDIVVKDIESLKRCYVFGGAKISPEEYMLLRGSYKGEVYPYWEYEKILKEEAKTS